MAETKWYVFSTINPVRQIRYFGLYLLDEGGFGQVWAGLMGTGVPVAIKTVKPSPDAAADWARWMNEQKIYLQCLSHEHIVTTFDQFYSPEGYLVIVMEKAGGSLDDFLRAGQRFDPLAVCMVGMQILSALHHIYAIGVIHRDVTPKNILWVFKLADFGISKAVVEADELARTLVGHKTFIPPELLASGYSSHQSDIYQLGLVLLSLLTGDYPIPTDASIGETRRLILAGAPRQLAESLVPEHGDLARVLSIMLRRRDAWRYQTAMDAWRDLYQEFERRKKLAEIAEWLRGQPTPQLPPWLTERGHEQ